jgi:ABC-type branched-subunit amino acid transport system substrate-binding protein
MLSRRNLIAAAAAAVAVAAGPAAAQTTVGVTDDSIRIGNIMPYSGPASAYGQIGEAMSAYIDKVNAEGGVNGRTIEFISYDDGYQPPRTVEQARKLVERDEVAFIFGVLGTPTNSAIHRYMNARSVPQLFNTTGATKWGDPENYPWTMGWQPPYSVEAKIYAKYILDNHPDAKVGILFQNDDYGRDYLEGFKEGLGDKADEMIVDELPYEVADPTVDSQVIALKAAGADVFFNITTPKFAAQAIKKAHEIDWNPVHLLNNVSSSVGSVLSPAGFEASQGLLTVGFLMDPTDPQFADHPETVAWREFMNEHYPDGDQTSTFPVQGYSMAVTLIHVLEKAGDDLSRENIMATAASLDGFRAPMVLPGITLNTSPDDFFPIEALQLQRFEGEGWNLFGDVISAESS